MSIDRLRFSVVLFDGFELLDVFGPVQLLKSVPELRVVFAGPTTTPVPSSQGVEVVPTITYDHIEPTDILLVPGGSGTRGLVRDHDFLTWLHAAGSRAPLITSVCTGSAVLAAAGLLEGYSATSNKRAFTWARNYGTSVSWRPAARWVHDRDRWTSSGVAAGMDMTAALIAHLRSEEDATEASNRAEYEPHLDSDWDPFAQLNGLVQNARFCRTARERGLHARAAAMTPDDLRAVYEVYLDACNRHDLAGVAKHLAPVIVVNDETKTPAEYTADLAALFESFPDYNWTLARSVVEGHWIAVHLRDHGTRRGPFQGAPGDGAAVNTDEFAIYHFDEHGLIEHVEVSADNARLTAQG